jgi:hypothetical protein
LFPPFLPDEAACEPGASRMPNDLARWPRWRDLVLKMCFSEDGWVA